MIIMALDHTRDFFHFDVTLHDPLDLQTTSVPLYFTRWITNYCAPVFVFLSGTSIFLQHLRKPTKELSQFLIKRGIWLIFVELFIIGFAWSFDLSFSVFVLQVIFAIGISMIFMGGLIRLQFKVLLALGIAIIAGHNILNYIEVTHHGFFWDIAFNGNNTKYELVKGHDLYILYPCIPWLGLMILGYCFGRIYEPTFEIVRRKRILLYSGFACILLFFLLRYTNSYGNPVQWAIQRNSLFTVLSFLNVSKYPPSLLYDCITIGPALLFLAFFENVNNKFSRFISIYGRVPFFYYVLHFLFIHLLSILLDNGFGYSLKIVYLIWIIIILILYPLCFWFSELKKRNTSWWLSYL